ncbi:MAG TPA: hypothetical protein VIK32_07065, partial [Candidatus Limnocylindrales bacterium]
PRRMYEGKIGLIGQEVSPPAWSPDGSSIAVATGERLIVVSADSGEQRVAIDDRVLAFAWSPDGGRFAYVAPQGNSSHLLVVHADGGSALEVSKGPIGSAPDWSPDGNRIVFSANWKRQDGTYWISPDGEIGLIAPYEPGAGETPEPNLSLGGGCETREGGSRWECVSPDGSRVATTDPVMQPDGRGFPSLAVLSAEAGTRTDIAPAGVDVGMGRPAWSLDSQRIAFRGSDADDCWLYSIDLDGSDLRRIVSLRGPTACSCPEEDVWALWAPDGDYIYYVKGAIKGEGCAPGFLYRVDADGTDERQLADLRVGSLYGFAP